MVFKLQRNQSAITKIPIDFHFNISQCVFYFLGFFFLNTSRSLYTTDFTHVFRIRNDINSNVLIFLHSYYISNHALFVDSHTVCILTVNRLGKKSSSGTGAFQNPNNRERDSSQFCWFVYRLCHVDKHTQPNKKPFQIWSGPKSTPSKNPKVTRADDIKY